MAQSDAQTNLRFPIDLKKWLQKQADLARRSLTAEVVLRLEASRQADLKPTTPKENQ